MRKIMKFLNGKKKEKCTKKGGVLAGNNNCSKCREGCVFGQDVYCNIDGHFRPLCDAIACVNFVSGKQSG